MVYLICMSSLSKCDIIDLYNNLLQNRNKETHYYVSPFKNVYPCTASVLYYSAFVEDYDVKGRPLWTNINT